MRARTHQIVIRDGRDPPFRLLRRKPEPAAVPGPIVDAQRDASATLSSLQWPIREFSNVSLEALMKPKVVGQEEFDRLVMKELADRLRIAIGDGSAD